MWFGPAPPQWVCPCCAPAAREARGTVSPFSIKNTWFVGRKEEKRKGKRRDQEKRERKKKLKRY
jgi:hypothetical protein